MHVNMIKRHLFVNSDQVYAFRASNMDGTSCPMSSFWLVEWLFFFVRIILWQEMDPITRGVIYEIIQVSQVFMTECLTPDICI